MRGTLPKIQAAVLLILLLCAFPFICVADGAPVITRQPEDLAVSYDREVSFSVEATGENLTFRWEYRKTDAEDWTAYPGTNDSTLYIYTNAEMDGWRFRCRVSGAGGTRISSEAALTVSPCVFSWSYVRESRTGEETVYTQYRTGAGQDSEAVINGEAGDRVVYSVNAQGHDLSYQWYYSKSIPVKWIPISGETGSSLSLELDDAFEGRYINCVVTAPNGRTDELYRKTSGVVNPYVRLASQAPENQREIEATYDLYYLSEHYRPYLSIPDSLMTEIDTGGRTSVKILSGESVSVEDNRIVPKRQILYSYRLASGFWVSSTERTGRADEVARVSYVSGDTVVRLDNSSNILVRVHSYAAAYAEGRMDAWLAAEIREDMTEYEKAEKCCAFVAGYSYGTDHSDYTGMIVTGAGDCWASTDALMYMLRKLGLTARAQSAGYVNGAGAQHQNVIARLDGLYYILEAGYVEEAPRGYSISAYGSPFGYTRIHMEGTEGIRITDFLNLDNQAEITVPDTIEGLPVISVGSGAFRTNRDVVRITLPETVREIGQEAFYQDFSLREISMPSDLRTIGDSAFAYCESLKTLRIPAGVESIGTAALFNCKSLTDISADPGNPSYSSADGALFSADGTTLLAWPLGRKGDGVVPAGVTTIGPYVFTTLGSEYTLDSLMLPDTLRDIQPYAFYHTKLDSLVIPEGVTAIAGYAFMDHRISSVFLPESLRRIEEGAFFRGDARTVSLPDGLTFVGPYAFAGDLWLLHIRIPASVQEIGEHAFDLSYGWSSMGGGESARDSYVSFDKDCDVRIGDTAFTSAVLGVWEGSSAHTYAAAGGLPYLLLNDGGKAALDASWFTGPSESYRFYGNPVTPTIEANWRTAPFVLQENSDFAVGYVNNDEIGTAAAVVRGTGRFTGEIVFPFEIKPGQVYISFNANGGEFSVNLGKTVTYGQEIGYLAKVFRKSDADLPDQPVFGFAGWYTKKSGGERITENTPVLFTSNQILYAHWKILRDLTGDGIVNLADYVFVERGTVPKSIIRLPDSLTSLEPQAFAGVSADVIRLPASLRDIPESALPASFFAVIEDGALTDWLDAHGISYMYGPDPD